MKIDRLMGILTILLRREKITANQLAERFEVSVRTIYRDVDTLCQAGIPVVTIQGIHGGISIVDDFKMDRGILSTAELQSILAGAKSLDELVGGNREQEIRNKLCISDQNYLSSNDYIILDLTSRTNNFLRTRITKLQEMIKNRKIAGFTYYGVSGKSIRNVEPYYLIYQWQSWYLWGYCREKCDFRQFKLTRMEDLHEEGTTYIPLDADNIPECKRKDWEQETANINLIVLFHKDTAWRIMEEFGPDALKDKKGDYYRVTFSWSDDNSIFGYLMSYRDQIIIEKPGRIRKEYQEFLKKAIQNQGKKKKKES